MLGPSKDHIRACHALIETTGRDFIADAAHVLGRDGDPYPVYEQLQRTWADAASDGGGLGPALNLQSSVLVMDDGTHRFLFSGDSELERVGIGNPVIARGIQSLQRKIQQNAPYDLVKVGHHGSDNALGLNVMGLLGEQTLNFGISTGSESKHHPSDETMRVLSQRRHEITWARTDRNGAVTFSFDEGEPTVATERGRLNEDSLADEGQGISKSPPAAPASAMSSSPEPPSPGVNRGGPVEQALTPPAIEIKIPYVPGSRVELAISLTITSNSSETSPVNVAGTDLLGSFRLAAGRSLPRLLFLTDRQKLGQNIGADAVAIALDSIVANHHILVDTSGLPGDPLRSGIQAARSALSDRSAGLIGVVLLGGYDVVPAQRRDALGKAMNAPERMKDADRFIVWSDAAYGDVDDDGLAEVPVSRVPDGKSAELFLTALGTPSLESLSTRHGIRNMARPFAEQVFAKLKGSSAMYCSHPHVGTDASYAASGDHLYFMLHGDHDDAGRYWGETVHGSLIEAVRIDHLQVVPGAIVLTGACWGALCVREPAGIGPKGLLTLRTASDSIALRCLAQGARAFVGCTGSHYSPTVPPFDYFGAPLHDEFWCQVQAGQSPAQALFNAKGQFAARFGKRQSKQRENIERKLFEQFTVLGLGW